MQHGNLEATSTSTKRGIINNKNHAWFPNHSLEVLLLSNNAKETTQGFYAPFPIVKKNVNKNYTVR